VPISIVSNHNFIAEALGQYNLKTKIHTYNSIAELSSLLNFKDNNILIFDFEEKISKLESDFIKSYSALVTIIILNNSDTVSDMFFTRITEIKKPFNIQFLYNLIENFFKNPQKIYQILEKIYFNPIQRLIIKTSGNKPPQEINLTEKENALLCLLILNQKTGPISKEKLVSEIFGYKDASATHTLETHIYRLRNKISAEEDIFTYNNKGYGLRYNFS
jgi:DNA-binding response OmpR family regulator